ncbi:MAG: hypothetical protein BTN85_2203 [Candidatus Methanohalarchaeum thermophilum]|uniref:Uncharacterized protein n=1 Tax=Methanohalarchaeum thermophilum TaxID=1903181 RepID=A0A1Q6DRS0_METT1|nr:MAG: hypothetical protein BTN85_2203 [Candidatus Methanohalarchaeum thermophilum]
MSISSNEQSINQKLDINLDEDDLRNVIRFYPDSLVKAKAAVLLEEKFEKNSTKVLEEAIKNERHKKGEKERE